MSLKLDTALTLGPAPFGRRGVSLGERVQAILTTRPGRLPWRPDFGCDLEGLVGYPVTPDLLSYARSQITSALKVWLQGVEVERVDVRAIPVGSGHDLRHQRTVPVAEAALLAMGVQALLEVEVEIVGPNGLETVTTTLQP